MWNLIVSVPDHCLSVYFVKFKPYRQHNRETAQDRADRGEDFPGKQTSAKYTGVRKKRLNPLGSDGEVLRCVSCGSYRHLLDVCSDSLENMERDDTRLSVDSHMKPLSLNNNKYIKGKEELKSISLGDETQLTLGEECNFPVGIAELMTEVASLKHKYNV